MSVQQPTYALFLRLPSHQSKCRKMPKSTNYGYGWYSEEQLDDYYNKLIGKNLEIFKALLNIL